MRIWQECEEYARSSGAAEVADDWGAAAMRCIRLGRGSSVRYEVMAREGSQWALSLRYRRLGETPAVVRVVWSRESAMLELHPTGGRKNWGWVRVPLGQALGQEVKLETEGAEVELDGFFLHDEPIDLPSDVRRLDEMIGSLEAASIVPAPEPRFIESPVRRIELAAPGRFLSDAAKESAGEAWPVLESLAGKPCPYIVNAYDTGEHTGYNSDFSWHALDKEKRWALPASGRLGLVNPNSDFCFTLAFSLDDDPALRETPFRPVLHTVDALIYAVSLEEDLRCEVAFRCFSSDTVAAEVRVRNLGRSKRRVIVWDIWGKHPLENPPLQRYVLPGQKFGAGVTTTAGGPAWTAGRRHCYYEWVRGRSRGRRLLVTTAAAAGRRAFLPESRPPSLPWPAEKAHGTGLVVAPEDTVACAIALNMRRFTLHDTWNPEITPSLYRVETEEEAIEAGSRACERALSDDSEGAIRRSVQAYHSYPRITLPVKSWETDFYACLELPRASTFSALGAIETPFYNFCRVHAHEPFGWWSYGMHAHEDLCTLFTNLTDPHLSASFLLGHIRHQQPDGMYPYGVSHTINPRLTTREATAPLILWEAWQSYLWSGDREFLREAYESGERNHEWWLSARDRCGEGLCHWLNTSGESVRDDDGLPTWQATGGSQYQEALDLNCYLLVQARTLARMAAELGMEDDSRRHWDAADRTARTMNAHMWHAEDGCYYGVGEVEPAWARVKDISTFFPLWARLAPEGRFERIAGLITDPDTFGLPCGPSTLAANEPGFGPEKHWFGSNWVEMSLFAIFGLRHYGFHRLAAGLAERNTRMVFEELERYGHFREYFNSMSGAGVDLIDYIWTAMPAHFIAAVFLGIEPAPEGLRVLPALPEGWPGAAIEDLRVRGMRVSVSVGIDPDARETAAWVDGQPVEVAENRGITLAWDQLHDATRIEIIQPSSIPDRPAAPPDAPRDWSDIPPHRYPGEGPAA